MERQNGKTNEPEALTLIKENHRSEDNRLVHFKKIPGNIFCNAAYVYSHRDCYRRIGENQ